MDVPDAFIGKLILVSTTTIFVLSAIWINTYPFIDQDSPLSLWLSDPQWVVLWSALWGLAFTGSLMCFTLHSLGRWL